MLIKLALSHVTTQELENKFFFFFWKITKEQTKNETTYNVATY